MGACDDFVAMPSSLEVEAVVELSSSSVAFWAWVVEEPHVEVLVLYRFGIFWNFSFELFFDFFSGAFLRRRGIGRGGSSVDSSESESSLSESLNSSRTGCALVAHRLSGRM